MPWYEGPTLLEHLETIPVGDHAGAELSDARAVGQSAQPDSVVSLARLPPERCVLTV